MSTIQIMKKAPQKSSSLQNIVMASNDDDSKARRNNYVAQQDRTNFASSQKQLSFQPMLRSYSSSSLLMRPPHIELVGSRVVRGPNWKWGRQDG